MKIERVCQHTVLPELIESEGIVIDAGAHRGEFSQRIHASTGARVYGLEANPDLMGNLRDSEGVEFIGMALAGESGRLTFHKQEPEKGSLVFQGESRESVTVRAMTLEAFCAENKIESVALLKLDIEGAEIDVLKNTPDRLLSRIGQITVEFHDFLDSEQVPEIQKIFVRLKNLGFYGIRLSVHTWGDCLFINRQLHPFGMMERLNLHVTGKYLPGFSRVWKKLW